jgi:hypothetical protein
MGRWSRERHAQEAAKKANQAAQAAPAPSPEQVEPQADKPEGNRPPPRNEPRRLAMEEIEAREASQRGVEPEPKVEPKAEPKPEPKVEVKSEIPEPRAEAKTEAAPPVERVKVKVDGEEFEVSQSEIDDAGGVRAYQTQKAADNRLKKANEALAETRKTQAAIAQWVQQQAPKEPTVTDDQFIQSKVDAIRYGTPEESANALKEVLNRANPRIDPQIITQQAVSTMQMHQAIDNFNKEFQDVASNPILYRAAVALKNERWGETSLKTDWNDFYRKIGNEVRSAVGRQPQTNQLAVAPTSDTPSPQSDKEARKASIVNLPTAAARATPPAESKPETREDTLNAMRKARGIPTG